MDKPSKTIGVFLREVFFAIVLIAITVIAVRLFLPEHADLGNQNHDISDQKIVIIPMTGIPMNFLHGLEKKLEELHDTNVLVTTAMGKGKEMLLPDSEQYNSEYLAGFGLDIAKRIGRKDSFTIVLTNEDINHPNSGLRYVYSTHHEGISVVSLARINDMNFGVVPRLIRIPSMFSKMQERALKLINKAIGYGAYGYEVSSDIGSVMYGPIMGPKDLDRVGNWYSPTEREAN